MSAAVTPMYPNALDAEEALLGSILIDPEALLAARTLKAEDFYRDARCPITHSRLADPSATLIPDNLPPDPLLPSKAKLWPVAGECTGVFCQGECVCGEHVCDPCGFEAGALVDNHPWYYDRREVRRGLRREYCYAPATVASRWKTPMCERCWQIASRGQGIDPRSYQPRPFGPIPGDEEAEGEEARAGD